MSVELQSWHWYEIWPVKLLFNILGYASILLPGYFLVKYYQKHGVENYSDDNSCYRKLVRSCVFGNEEDSSSDNKNVGISTLEDAKSKPEESQKSHALALFFCFCGLQTFFLVWGIMQEKIMTKEYNGHKFNDPQFIIFMNLALAGVLAVVGLNLVEQPVHRAPLYSYSFISLSNIMSSWCQYEALKFVSFPTQVLAKACRIIPVMIMGKFVNKTTYPWYEYVFAGMISMGVTIFLLTSSENKHPEAVTTGSGVLLLVGYLLFDSFTSNYQSSIFKQYGVSSMQMMAAANFWSCLLTLTSLLEQGTLITSLKFMVEQPRFALDISLLSVCLAVGQLFIYYTIYRFGPVVFIIIMTTRQGFAILLSCLIYKHPVSGFGLCGILLVFSALFLRIYVSHRKKQQAAKPKPLPEDEESGTKSSGTGKV